MFKEPLSSEACLGRVEAGAEPKGLDARVVLVASPRRVSARGSSGVLAEHEDAKNIISSTVRGDAVGAVVSIGGYS